MNFKLKQKLSIKNVKSTIDKVQVIINYAFTAYRRYELLQWFFENIPW